MSKQCTKKGAEVQFLHPLLSTMPTPMLIAHRGASGSRPENTLQAFQRALDCGVDMLELDVHLTKDEQLIVCHDRTPLRTTNYTAPPVPVGQKLDMAKHSWNNFTLEEVKAMDAGHLFKVTNESTGQVQYPYRGKGVVIPTLDEVLTLSANSKSIGNDGGAVDGSVGGAGAGAGAGSDVGAPGSGSVVWINIDMKDHSARTPRVLSHVLRNAQSGDARQRCVACSMNETVLNAFRELEPDMLTGGAPKEVLQQYALDKVWLMGLHKPRAHILEVPAPGFIKKVSGWGLGSNFGASSFMAKVHSKGQKIFHWTVNDADEMRTLIAQGSDGLLTDHPEMGRNVFTELGLKPPLSAPLGP